MNHMGESTHQRGAKSSGGGGAGGAGGAGGGAGGLSSNPAMSGSNSMGSDPYSHTLPNPSSRRSRYDDDGDAEVGCMGASGADQDVNALITRRRRIAFAAGAAVIVFVVILAAGSAALMDGGGEASLSRIPLQPGAGGGLGYAPRDALALSRSECSPDALVDMAKASGVDASRVEIADFPCESCPGGKRRGLAAKGDIAKGQTIVEAEWRAVLSAEHSMEELSEALSLVPDMTPHEKLALKLLYHRFLPGSKLTPYVCSLPGKVGTPLEWDDDEVHERFPKLSEAGVKIKSAKLYLMQEYNRIMPLLFSRLPKMFDASVHTPEAWVWAMQVVKSRNWNVGRKREPSVSVAMVPLADMINHVMGVQGAARSNLDGSKFTILAWQDYKDGDEVFTSYGDDCNLYYLLTYGFEINGNQHECVHVNETRSWEGKEASLNRHFVMSGLGSSSVSPKSGRISA